MPPGPPPPHRQVRVVLATALERLRPPGGGRGARALLSIASASRAAALALPDLGFAAFFIAGIATAALGNRAPWFVLAAVGLGLLCRRPDLESWALLNVQERARRVWIATGAVLAIVAWGAITALVNARWPPPLPSLPQGWVAHGWREWMVTGGATVAAFLLGFAHALPAVGSGDSLW